MYMIEKSKLHSTDPQHDKSDISKVQIWNASHSQATAPSPLTICAFSAQKANNVDKTLVRFSPHLPDPIQLVHSLGQEC